MIRQIKPWQLLSNCLLTYYFTQQTQPLTALVKYYKLLKKTLIAMGRFLSRGYWEIRKSNLILNKKRPQDQSMGQEKECLWLGERRNSSIPHFQNPLKHHTYLVDIFQNLEIINCQTRQHDDQTSGFYVTTRENMGRGW